MSDLLKEEKSDIDLIGPTLQSLKLLLDAPPAKTETVESTLKFNRIVHGLLSACLSNIDEMRHVVILRDPILLGSYVYILVGDRALQRL